MTAVLRPVTPITTTATKPLRPRPIPPPPKISWLPLSALVIDESYQRALSHRSIQLVRRLVETWDWNCFKPLSVAPVEDGQYEVVDGQHTAIAAATHGAIDMLPCLVLDATTRAERSKAFVGINRDRIALTAFALYRARLIAGEAQAVAVDAALTASGASLREAIRYDEDTPAGTCSCTSTLLLIVRGHGQEILTRALTIARQAEVSPIPAAVLKALADMIAASAASDEGLTAALLEHGGEDLVDKANERRRAGAGGDTVAACVAVLTGTLRQLEGAA